MLWRGVGIHNTRSMTWLLKALMKARASQLSQPCGIHYVAALIFGVALTRGGFPSTTATGALYPISVSATRLSSLAHHVLCSLVVPPVVAQGKLRAERTRRARRCACPRRQHPLACPLDRKSPSLRGHGSAPLPQRCLPVHANTLSAHAMPPRAQPRALHAQAPLHCCRFPRLPASIALESPRASSPGWPRCLPRWPRAIACLSATRVPALVVEL